MLGEREKVGEQAAHLWREQGFQQGFKIYSRLVPLFVTAHTTHGGSASEFYINWHTDNITSYAGYLFSKKKIFCKDGSLWFSLI